MLPCMPNSASSSCIGRSCSSKSLHSQSGYRRQLRNAKDAAPLKYLHDEIVRCYSDRAKNWLAGGTSTGMEATAESPNAGEAGSMGGTSTNSPTGGTQSSTGGTKGMNDGSWSHESTKDSSSSSGASSTTGTASAGGAMSHESTRESSSSGASANAGTASSGSGSAGTAQETDGSASAALSGQFNSYRSVSGGHPQSFLVSVIQAQRRGQNISCVFGIGTVTLPSAQQKQTGFVASSRRRQSAKVRGHEACQ